MLHMDRIGLGEPYVTINATTRIPARVRLVGVIHSYSHHILALLDVWCDVVLKARIAIGTEAHFLSVYIHGRVHVHTIELDKHFLNLVEREMLSVPPYSSRQGSSTCTTWVSHVEVALNGPVMGHIELTPETVVVIHLRHLS